MLSASSKPVNGFGRASRVGGAEKGADQPIAIERVEREAVDVDAAPRDERHDRPPSADDQPLDRGQRSLLSSAVSAALTAASADRTPSATCRQAHVEQQVIHHDGEPDDQKDQEQQPPTAAPMSSRMALLRVRPGRGTWRSCPASAEHIPTSRKERAPIFRRVVFSRPARARTRPAMSTRNITMNHEGDEPRTIRSTGRTIRGRCPRTLPAASGRRRPSRRVNCAVMIQGRRR